MRHARGLLLVVSLWSAIGCSDAASGNSDPLRGVSEATAERLCKGFFVDADALRTARNTISPDAVDAAASGYEQLATEARAAGATSFASEMSDAATAAHVLAQSNRDVIAAGASGSASDQAAPLAAFLTKVAKLQLPETQISLACYSRGYVPSGS